MTSEIYLSFFSEIIDTETLRRLVFTACPHTGEDEDNECYNIRYHLIQFLEFHVFHSRRNIKIEDVQTAEQNGCKYAEVCFP